MEFRYNKDNFIWNVAVPNDQSGERCSDFDSLLQKTWNAASESGVCRYRLDELQTKILPGKFGFVAQLNTARATQRRKPQDLQKVNSPFDPYQFNFNKVANQEILIRLSEKGTSHSIHGDIIINVSPLEFCNSLLVPAVTANLPQKVTHEGLDLLVKVILLSSDPNLKAGFNSPGAYASVNHQHYHLYYLKERLSLEQVEVEHIAGPCFAISNFPSKGFVFQMETDDPSLLAKNAFTLVSYLQDNEIAHNLFVTRGKRFDEIHSNDYGTVRVFIFAREPTFGVKEEFEFTPALCELAGHLLVKEPVGYETITENIIAELLTKITLPWFEQVRARIPSLFKGPM